MIGASSSDVLPFPAYEEKFAKHGREFDPRYSDAEAYKHAAQDIANDVVVRCCSASGGRHISFTGGSVVIVQNGVIQTYYVADAAQWAALCNS